MKLSILIPTHNRQHLFTRCIKSIVPYLNDNIEVIVNNDSRDITEIRHPNIQYHYNQYPKICSIYEFLLHQASGEYVWYVEDDDYLVWNLAIEQYLTADMIAGNYNPQWQLPALEAYRHLRQFRDRQYDAKSFVENLDIKLLQLGQYIFRRELILDYPFANDNNIYNDLDLVLHCASNIVGENIRTIRNVLYHQTIDGNDNISFPMTKPSIDTVANYNFLEKYPQFKSTVNNTNGNS